MKIWLKIVLFGIGVWAIPFGFGMLLFSIQATQSELFDTLMTISICTAAVLFGTVLARRPSGLSRKNAMEIGFAWVSICIIIDIPIFVFGLGMKPEKYIADIGLTYLILPIVLFGLAVVSRAPKARLAGVEK